MKKIRLYPFLITLALINFSCNKDEDGDMLPDDPVGTATFTVSGAESASLNYDVVEFTYLVNSVSGSELSSLTVYIGNIGTTETAFKIELGEFGNTNGFSPGTYSLADVTDDFLFISLYVTEDDIYTLNQASTEVNSITLTKVTDTKIEGSFEVNLEQSVSGAKVKLKGTFEAVGEALKV